METDAIVITAEAKIAKLMTVRRQHRAKIKKLGEQINKLELIVRLRKVQINNERIDKKV